MSNRPKPEEYVPYQAAYIDLVNGEEDIIDLLANLMTTTYEFFMDLDTDQDYYGYAEGKWTLKQVLGHMIDAERTFAYRILAFSRGQKELPGFEQDEYIELSNYNNHLLHDLAEEFRTVREANLYLYRSLMPQQLLATGVASGNPISVRALLYIAAGHEMHHLNIINEKYLL